MAKPTLYQVLGVKPDVKHHEITFLYDRRISALRREEAPPDTRVESAMREAFEVLSDPERRAAYDHELARERMRPAFGRWQAVAAMAFIVLVAGGVGGYYLLRASPAPGAADAASLANIANQASAAVGRLQVIEMSGATRPAGLAFAIDDGVMIASCGNIAPTVALSVKLALRVAPARLASSDAALGICKLDVKGAGSWPLRLAGGVRAGDVVYATAVDAVGQVSLREARVKALLTVAGGRIVDTTIAPSAEGAPLLDAQGRVVAVASNARYVMLAASWALPPVLEPSQPASVPLEPAATPGQDP